MGCNEWPIITINLICLLVLRLFFKDYLVLRPLRSTISWKEVSPDVPICLSSNMLCLLWWLARIIFLFQSKVVVRDTSHEVKAGWVSLTMSALDLVVVSLPGAFWFLEEEVCVPKFVPIQRLSFLIGDRCCLILLLLSNRGSMCVQSILSDGRALLDVWWSDWISVIVALRRWPVSLLVWKQLGLPLLWIEFQVSQKCLAVHFLNFLLVFELVGQLLEFLIVILLAWKECVLQSYLCEMLLF